MWRGIYGSVAVCTYITVCLIFLVSPSKGSFGCKKDWFHCKDASECIPPSWKCDGDDDCPDGSDEKDCESSERKRRSTTEDLHPDEYNLFACPPNYKRCPEELQCIPLAKFCDNHRDCPLYGHDEGSFCNNEDMKDGCSSMQCEKCANIPQGVNVCYCDSGRVYNQSDRGCVDANECNYEGFCDQICHNKDPMYKCDCKPGYMLVGASGSCKAINNPEHTDTTLLIADYNKVLQVTLEGDFVQPSISVAGHRIMTLDFDHRNKSACWITYHLELRQSQLQCIRLDDTSIHWQIKPDISLDTVEHLAKDWLTGNFYFTNAVLDQRFIVLCNSEGKRCKAIIKFIEEIPKGLAIDPTKGYLFFITWSEGQHSTIERSLMDGSKRMALQKINLVSPYGITLDYANEHIYWTDDGRKVIERMDYDGSNRKLVYSPLRLSDFGEIVEGFGISVFENYIYVSSQSEKLPGVMKMHRSNYAEAIQAIVKYLERPFQVQVYHRQRQPDISEGQRNPCSTDHPPCDQLCVVDFETGVPEPKCLCGAGYYLDNGICIRNPNCTTNCKEQESCGEECHLEYSCRANYSRCPGNACIPQKWWCDQEIDCPDGIDEQYCDQRTCTVLEFRCANGHCIQGTYQCDGSDDCGDNSDEKGCPTVTCIDETQIKCNNSGEIICLSREFKCDKEVDCPDGSDEQGCDYKCNNLTEFTCGDSRCIPSTWRCDGDEDCGDSSDEHNCISDHKCAMKGDFTCLDGKKCIPQSWRCDKDFDCEDKSDEKNCSVACLPPNVLCQNDNKTCLPLNKLCDGVRDCSDGWDETGECLSNTTNCDKNCTGDCKKTPTGYVCDCPMGQKLGDDGVTCEYENICETWGICSQNCTVVHDTKSRKKYQCSCFDGYIFKDDNYTCKVTDQVYIIFSNRHEMRRVDLTDYQYPAPLVSGLRNTIALDFFYKEKFIFWTDVVDDKIYRGKMLSNSLTHIEPIIDVGLATTEGLAVDWIGENIYWVESNLDQIEVAKLNGSIRTTLIAGDMESPRAIVVDPREGWLFWTDWHSENPRIERCSMNGDTSTRKQIFAINQIADGGWPNGLTIDYDFSRLYWIDARSDSIHTIRYDGSDHRTVLKDHNRIGHPFAITLFGNYVYWTDWTSNELVKANKFNGSEFTVIQKTVTQPFDLQVFHQKRQPDAFNPCAINNGGCSDLCLIGHNRTVGCHCPHLTRLKSDNKTCEPDNKFLLFVKSNEIRGVDLKNPNFNVIPTLTVPHVDHPAAIDYDVIGDRLYWADKGLNKINSAYVNGSGVETIIDSGISNPEGFAIDWLSRNMYFSSTSSDSKKKASISVAKLDGAYRAEIIINNISQPNSIAVHPTKGLMFWADVGGQDHRIYRAKMDGTDTKVIINDTKRPSSLTIDIENHQLFFINRGNRSIMSCSLNGSSCRTIKRFQNQEPISLTLYNSNTLYVSHGDEIGKMNTIGSDYQPLRKKTPAVQALLVYDENSRKKVTQNGNACAKENKYGGCAQLCLPTSQTSRVCKCTAGFRNINEVECVGITSFLLFSTETEIRGISFSINDTLEALPLISKISMASGVDFNADQDMIYWVDSSAHTISRIKRDLTQRETIMNDEIPGIEDLAVDWISNNVYWTDNLQDVIEVVKDDGSRYVVVHGNLDKPKSIIVHPNKGYLFWTDVGNVPKIEQSRLDGSERTEIVNTSIKNPAGLTIDYETDTIYWCDRDLKLIESYNIITKSRRNIIPRSGISDCASITLYKDHIYWLDADGDRGSIKRAEKLTGGNIKTIRTDLGVKLRDIIAFEKSRQNGTNICASQNGNCSGLCFYVGDNERNCACSYGSLAMDKRSCLEHGEFLLYSRITSIESIHMTQNNHNPPLKSISNPLYMKNVIGLTADYKTKRIYFSDIQRGDIQFVDFNGTSYTVVVDSVGSAEGLAFNPSTDEEELPYLYWTSYTNSSISRAKIHPDNGTVTGKIEKVLQLGIQDHPRAIVIDSCSSQMFWTNWNDLSPKIQRAYLSGYQAKSIITENIRTPNGLAIDHLTQKLYWSDARLDKIEHSDFDGKNRVVLITGIPQHSFGLAVYGDYIYWTDWMLRAVIRVNKYDGSMHTTLRSQLDRQPMGIIAVAEDMDDCTVNPCYENQIGCEELCMLKKGKAYCSCSEGILLPDGKRCGNMTETCGVDHFVCHDMSGCILYSKTCNGIPDCLDASDEFEEVCDRAECDVGWFTCHNHRCVKYEKRCDGHNDCGDGSDEKCHCNRETEFQCNTGLCIQKQYRCDRDRDCPDFSDEIGCNMTCNNLEMMEEIPGHFVSCNTTSQCIMVDWICDGNADCWDNHDEENCGSDAPGNDSCPGSFQCNNSKSCIPLQWRCDSDNDCGDNSDEFDCTYKCADHMFRCEDQTCLPRSWRCDGHPDCLDKSDEGDHCTLNQTCKEDEFNCTNGRCIPKQWMCDGDSDCPDGEDERIENGCPTVICDKDEFECLNRRCIRKIFFCDRDNDCGDNSDEPPTCVYQSCNSTQFKCTNNGTCIDLDLKCNGFPDCPDHSDEMKCIPEEDDCQFRCINGVCINDTAVCDGNNDCGDSSDETSQCNFNECSPENIGQFCAQKCIDLKLGYKCDCFSGYKLRSDNYTCEDIDECKTTYPCSQFCINTQGSYKCHCAEGYQMERDHRTCKMVNDTQPIIILANRYYIRNITFHGDQRLITQGLSNAVAIDFHWDEQMIYWSDITSKNSSICRLNITGGNNEKEILHNTTVKNPDGIAVDWIAQNLYWCDKTTDTIEVSRLNGRYRKILIGSRLQEPRGLEVFPSKGLMFYSDWGETAHISSANMDGTNIRKIITQDIVWPNALTLDYITEKIFWADASLDYIAMANLDGSDRHIVVDNDLPHTFALTTFMDYIFWTDWEHLSLQRVHKFSGANRSTVAHIVHRPMDLQVFHPVRQVPLSKNNNPCYNNGGCSHLCLLRQSSDTFSLEGVCACPENHFLETDKKTCASNCTSSQFLCHKTSECIPQWWYCDSRVDCEDGSDEPENCPDYPCTMPGMFKCDNSTKENPTCISPVNICDGQPQCPDKSDEKDCDNFTCIDGYSKCISEPKCFSNTKKCDGIKDCKNGEDELNCGNSTCKSTQFQCKNGRCVPYVWLCDQDDDCGDMSDEPGDCTWTNTTCRPNYIRCNKTGRCIPESWQCDGDNDCGPLDQSDENPDICNKQTCAPSYFKCENNHCIPGRWRCDYDNDCRDGSDEKNCQYRECSESEFRCGNHKCIPDKLKCDGEINCEDGSDETANCSTLHCSEDEFKCKKIPYCIPGNWHCDEDTDCSDGSDEWNCTHKCTAGQFQCNNSVCIPGLWQCDNDNDCDDSSDENPAMCEKHACAPGRLRCSNHKCVSSNKRCDGIDDCGDNSDEKFCEIARCKSDEYKCNASNQCIPTYHLCDNMTDCRDGSDEDSSICSDFDKCNRNNPCEQTCHLLKTVQLMKCSCKEGYRLREDGYSCQLQNSCKMYGVCPQKCTKEQTKPKCHCEEGYTEAYGENGHGCKATGTTPYLLIGHENELIGSSLGNEGQRILMNQISRIDAIDVDISEENQSSWKAFILNHLNRTITVVPLPGSKVKNKPTKNKRAAPSETVAVRGLSEPRGIAFDWIGKHIYWTDSGTRKVQMAKWNGEQQRTVAHGQLKQPFSIAVHPEAGKIYWTDRGYPAKIESANLDGSGRKELVKEDIIWPNGISVDYANDRIYWTDAKKHTVETVDLQGKDRHVVKKFNSSDPPYMIEVFEDYLYVTLYRSHSIVRVHKFNSIRKMDVKVLLKNAAHIGDIVVIQSSKQKSSIPNFCKSADCGAAMCVNMPQSNSNIKKYTCVCSDEAEYRETDKKCDFLQNCTCANKGNCTRVGGQPKCSCPPRYTGSKCERDKCTNFCQHGGKCIVPKTSEANPTCDCINGFYGVTCQFYRCNSYCLNGGRCSILNNKPACQCRPGYSGVTCEVSIANSSLCYGYCMNGGTCNVSMVNHLFGPIRVPRRHCTCLKGFTGERCEMCDNFECHNGGTCHVNQTTHQPYCECPEQFKYDPNCLWLPCDSLCLNGGTCIKDKNGHHACKCPPGYTGFQCQRAIKECSTYCKNGATCIKESNAIEEISCKCAEGFGGKQCENIVNGCGGFCKHGGRCTLGASGQPACICKGVFEGKRCNKCRCQNNGVCIPQGSDWKCSCGDLYDDVLCNRSICAPLCFNDGVCTNCTRDPINKLPTCHQCSCKDGFSGPKCATDLRKQRQTSAASSLIPIIVPVIAVCLLIVLVIIIVLLIRRKRDQFKHRRMPNDIIPEVSNPIYNPHSHEEEDDSARELDELYHEDDPSTHFANPMYDRYQSESTQVLLHNDDEDTNHLDENGDIQFKKSSKSSKKSPKKSPKKNQSNKNSFA